MICSRLLSSSKTCLKEMWRRPGKKEEEETQKISDPFMAAEWSKLYGRYARLMEELRVEDPQSFFNYLRMEPAMFDELVQRVGPRIEKQDANMRKALPTGFTVKHAISILL